MGRPMIVDPPRPCKVCGETLVRKHYGTKTLEDRTRFLRREHCSQACANSRPEVTKSAHHWRARQSRTDQCEECSTTEALHVHHKDRNHANDDPSNLVTLCASCHLKLHWREDREKRMVAARKAQATAVARYGANTRPRSTDGRWSSVG